MRKTIRYNFVSGKYMDVSFPQEKFTSEIKVLEQYLGNDCIGRGATYGFNYRFITHYEVID